MKKILAINGSARKNWNTHTLLSKALEGAKQAGAQTELINLYDIDYKGCIGCMACKVKGGKNLGHCAVKDGLHPILRLVDESDGLILGSPIYFGDITAGLRAFWERLIFQHLNYDDYAKPFVTGELKTAFIYTMNAPASFYEELYKKYETVLGSYFTYKGTVLSSETLQVNDYSKYHMASFNEAERVKRRQEVFPDDCQAAFDLGFSLAQNE